MIHIINRNGNYLGVKYAYLASTKPSIDMERGCKYAAFDAEGTLIALGEETGGPRTAGGWEWIKGEFDNRMESDLFTPPETVFDAITTEMLKSWPE